MKLINSVATMPTTERGCVGKEGRVAKYVRINGGRNVKEKYIGENLRVHRPQRVNTRETFSDGVGRELI